MSKYINCTPHAIRLNNGAIFAPSGNIARVETEYQVEPSCSLLLDGKDGSSCAEAMNGGFCKMECLYEERTYLETFKDVTGLPEPAPGVIYIVSAHVLRACPDRPDVVAPATGHFRTVRNDQGHIVSVPGFVKYQK